MCGICGIVTFNQSRVEEKLVHSMMNKIKHRGPDDEGTFFANNIGLGFVRLSILDLSPLGHQPMYDDSGRYIIIHNGEVYNYIEIRNELLKKGYTFRSNTDTEVILKSYIEYGEGCLDIFNGMWAFCIYDKVTQDIFISRDRYGVKPFYYYLDGERLIFASEIPAILSVLNQKPTPNEQMIFDYLVFNRTDHTEQTFFREILKLQHGHKLTVKDSIISIKKWYDLRSRISSISGFSGPDEYRTLFSSSVGLRLRSDVPVGVCLSGGLDSSSIVSTLLNEYDKKGLYTFSAVYGRKERGDESDFIELYKEDLANMYFCHPTGDTLATDLEEFLMLHAEPFPSTSIFAQYNVMKTAKEHVVVTLDGQGADETLAGYHDFFGYYFLELLSSLNFFGLGKEIFAYLKNHRSIFALQTMMFFPLPGTWQTKLRVLEKRYLHKEFVSQYLRSTSIPNFIYSSKNLRDSLINHFEYKLEHLLKWSDRNSMHFSIESRVPFLDYRLVEKSLATQSKMIIKNGMTKAILRDAMSRILPEKIRMRYDKVGFETPEAKWFREEPFRNRFQQLIGSKSFNERRYFQTESCYNLMELHLKGGKDNSQEIWKILSLELWLNQFID